MGAIGLKAIYIYTVGLISRRVHNKFYLGFFS